MKFTEILDLVGYSDYEIEKQGKNWELYHAKLKHMFEETTSDFLFFNSRATWESIDEARKCLPPRKVHIVIQTSAKIAYDVKRIKANFKDCTIKTVRELLSGVILGSIRRRDADIEEIKYFIDPNLINLKNKGKKKAVEMIYEWLNDPRGSNVAVIIGTPGVGKTTLAKHLYSNLNNKAPQYGRIPIIIISEQWSRFALNTSLTLWDIWKEAMTYSNISDQRENLFESCTKSGAIFPIFDGFDELCSSWNYLFNPAEVIEQLLKLIENEEGKILLTSRDVFWEENIPSEYMQKLDLFELQPFNKQQLARYLEKRFPRDYKARERARSLISEYEKIAYAPMDKFPPSELRLGNVPVVVDLLSTCAEDPANSSVDPKNDPIYEIIKMLCRREKKRQKIHTDEDTQINIFKDIAINHDQYFTVDQLEFWAQCNSEEFTKPAKAKAIHSHYLIDWQKGNYVFRYEFIPVYLGALYTADNIFNPSKYNELIEKVFSKYCFGTTTYFDYLEDIIVRKYNLIADYSNLSVKLAKCIDLLAKQPHWRELTSNPLIHLILRLIYRKNQTMTKRERTQELLKILGLESLRSITLTGIIKNLDFRNIVFENCTLSDIIFSNCDFNDNTELIKCKLQGNVSFENCGGVRTINKLIDCSIDSETRDALYEVIDSIGITPHQIEKWAYDFLKNFKSGIYYIKRGYNQLFRGIVFQKLDRDDFLNYFKKYNIVTVERGSAGADELYLINNEAKSDVSAFLENGIISGSIKKILEDLVKRYCD